jgi:hypothetical protein
MQGRQPTEEEMRAALQEELSRVRVEQVITEATVSILNIAVLRSGLVQGSEGERDLGQVRLGIEAVRSLLPLVEQIAGEEAKPIRDALAQLQMAYVRAADAGAGGGEPGGGEPGGGSGSGDGPPDGQSDGGGSGGTPGGGAPPSRQPPAGQEPGGAGPAQQSGRLWVPGQ